MKPLKTLFVGTDPDPNKRVRITVDATDAACVAAHPRDSADAVVVTNRQTGHTVRIRWADCGLGCRCALEFAPEPASDIEPAERTYTVKDARVMKLRVYVLLADETVDASVFINRVRMARARIEKVAIDAGRRWEDYPVTVETNPHGTCCVATVPAMGMTRILVENGFKETKGR